MIGIESLIWIIPAALAIVMLAVLSLERLLLLTLFLTPLSIQLSYMAEATAFDLSVPTEPVMAMLLIITIFKLVVTREFNRRLLRHPVTVVIAIWLLWSLLTSLTSTMPGVSFKTMAYRLWFIAGFYLIAAQLFSSDTFSRRYIIAYSAGLSVVVVYFLIRVGSVGLLNQQFAHSACYPFYRDHTSFGASMAFLIPTLIVILFRKGVTTGLRMLITALILLFAAGFIFSYSRAAWVSLLAAVIPALILWLRLPPRMLASVSVIFVVAAIMSAGWIWERMDSTTEDSSADLAQHLRSSSNISTDQSNLERINRWKSALKMFAEKPVTGWGPGTYQFNYGPFQEAADRTIISTDFGDAGNAHSEYLGALSESGLPGALLFIMITLFAVLTGIRVWYGENSTADSYFALAVLTGVMTYVIHAVMNSFLDSDKIAALWWGFIAMLVALDLKRKEKLPGVEAND